MNRQGSGNKVLRFAVTGALLGGGATACASSQKNNVNVAPVEEPQEHTNAGPEEDLHTNPGPEAEPAEAEPAEEAPHVNTAPVEGPPDAGAGGNEPPKVMVNPAPQPDPG